MSRAQIVRLIIVVGAVAIAALAFQMMLGSLSIGTIVIALCLVVFALVLAAQIFVVRKMDAVEISNIGDFSQGVASTLTAVTLVGAGLVYYYDTQWDPKVSVDIGAHGFLLRNEPKQVAIQTVLKIANQSKINLQFREAFVQLSFVDDRSVYPNKHGDLDVIDTRTFYSRRHKVVNAGETDFAYYEMVAPCEAALVRVLVKLPSSGEFNGEKLVYERKVLVPIAELCAGKATEIQAGSVF